MRNVPMRNAFLCLFFIALCVLGIFALKAKDVIKPVHKRAQQQEEVAKEALGKEYAKIEDKPKEEKEIVEELQLTLEYSAIETTDFVFVEVDNHYKDGKDIDILNKWLKGNPDRKVVSITAVLDNHDDKLAGYIIYFEKGDNHLQNFVRVYYEDYILEEDITKNIAHWIKSLQDWKDKNLQFKIMAITQIPSSFNREVRAFTMCYEIAPSDKIEE